MKNIISIAIVFVVDLVAIFISLWSAHHFWEVFSQKSVDYYTCNMLIYAIVIITLASEKIYTHRLDFWEETRLTLRGLMLGMVIVLSVLALMDTILRYDQMVIITAFIIMAVLIPTLKRIIKTRLFYIGLWRREAEMCGQDETLLAEIFSNPYLGYVHSDQSHAQTLFVNTMGISPQELQIKLDSALREKKEVLFIPFLQSYIFSNANIIELSNARKNLIVLENRLLKPMNIWIKKVWDLFLSLLLLPLLLLIFGVIVLLIKREEPKGTIFFRQKRMGQNGQEFLCYKFRSMRENSEAVLRDYLEKHPEEVTNYETYHKYKNDPRITKIGALLRKTSLDEVPQIINVLKGEMSLIGPRPYMPNEKEKIGERVDMVLAVKPGVTGLWQVSGRSEVDFHSRVDMDVWYTRNWNLWLDLVILIKTVKVVLLKNGAH